MVSPSSGTLTRHPVGSLRTAAVSESFGWTALTLHVAAPSDGGVVVSTGREKEISLWRCLLISGRA